MILFKPTISFVSKNSSRSLRNTEKRKVYRFSPCLTPISQLKYPVVWLLYEIHDLTLEYILNKILYILPFMLLSNNLWKRPSLHTLSKAFSKSINAQYNFFFFDFKIWNNVNIEKILSMNSIQLLTGSQDNSCCYTLSYLMLSNVIFFPVFSFTGLSRPAYKLFLNLYPALLPFQIAVCFAIVYNWLISLF